MLKSGLPSEIAKVLRDMYRLKFDKDLSFGERRLLDWKPSRLLVRSGRWPVVVAPSAVEGRDSWQIFSGVGFLVSSGVTAPVHRQSPPEERRAPRPRGV